MNYKKRKKKSQQKTEIEAAIKHLPTKKRPELKWKP